MKFTMAGRGPKGSMSMDTTMLGKASNFIEEAVEEDAVPAEAEEAWEEAAFSAEG